MNVVLFCCGIGTRNGRAMNTARDSRPLDVVKTGQVTGRPLSRAHAGGAS